MKSSLTHEEALRVILESIGKKLAELRIQKGYKTPTDFASDYNLPRIQYWRIEKGRSNITMKSLHKLLAIHDKSFEELFKSISDGQTPLQNGSKTDTKDLG